ncbi:MAG: M20/M25/M40 family metallo-hydrolase [Longimicrobiales bacterium]|nr:M20/M25/M40 family metallo-hydrolase [Longimicrobiales bacterium]
MNDDLSHPTSADHAEAARHPGMERLARRLIERHDALVAFIRGTDGVTIDDQIEVTSVPAPPFGEGARAEWMARRLRRYGALHVEIDGVGNVVARLPGGERHRAPFVVSAHLDTVFPSGTDVRHREEEGRIYAPGISDDGRGLAALLTLTRALVRIPDALTHPVVVAATVGEEGLGDLRGVRALFEGGAAREAAAFISLDGAGLTRVVNGGVGSRRWRYTVSGPGGHSWVEWGRPNPIVILAHALAALPAAEALVPGTTWSAGRIGGGTSVNAIPESAWVEVEARAMLAEALEALEAQIRSAFESAVSEANRAGRQTTPDDASPLHARLSVEAIGDRPAGATPARDPLVTAAVAATRALDLPVELATSSTDANLPMSLAIPAITLGAGGEAHGAHTLGEWYRNTLGPEGILRALLTLLVWDHTRATSGSREAAD